MTTSYRQILRSSSIIGGATVGNIAIGLAKMKVAALVLGPVGIGTIGLLQSLVQLVSTAASFGLGTVGTRQIAEAEARSSEAGLARARRSLFWFAIVVSFLGGSGLWLARHFVATDVLDGSLRENAVAWMAVAVVLTVWTLSQSALLRGLRRVGDVARVTILSACLSAIVGLVALFAFGQSGIVAFVIAGPLATVLCGWLYVRKLPQVADSEYRVGDFLPIWGTLLRVGSAFMISAAFGPLGNFLIRTMIQSDLGEVALGQYQAAWMIAMTYLGLILSAMATDYYPRLTAVIHKAEDANRLVDEQSEVAALMSAPVLILMLGLSHWIVPILYSHDFSAAVPVLQLHVLGDVLKVMSWPLGIMILAAGNGRMLIFTEASSVIVYVLVTWMTMPFLGLLSTGVGFFAMYLTHLSITMFLARRATRYVWSKRIRKQFWLLSACICVVFLLSFVSIFWAASIGIVTSVGFSLYAGARISFLMPLPQVPHRIGLFCQRVMTAVRVRYV